MDTWNDPGQDLEVRADALLRALSLEEKVGQLASFWPQPETSTGVTGDAAPMENALHGGLTWEDSIKNGLGHLTRIFGTGPVTVHEGVQLLRRRQAEVVTQSRLGIPALAHEECLTGFTTLGATVYPAAIAWGATFDPDLVEEMAAAIGSDMAAVGVQQGLSPLLDVVRDYRWGRVEETLGEDPYLVGTLGSAYVRGLQGAGVDATLKHFVGYSASKAGRNHAPVQIGPRELEDVLLPPFEMAVREGGVRSVMNSYSDLDGEPAGASPGLLTTILRDRWGFTGTVVSDYWSVVFLHLMHRVAGDVHEAGRLALRAGMDVELPGTTGFAELAAAVQDGLLDETYVDRACRRVLRQKIALGLLDPDFDVDRIGRSVDLDSARNRAVARRLAEQSIVLLANEGGTLPLAPDAGTVALVGPCADDPRTFLGCYSFPNHVLSRHEGREGTGVEGLGIDVPSLRAGLEAELGADRVVHERGVPVLGEDPAGIEAAVAAVRRAGVAVVAVGDLAGLFGLGTSGEGCDVVDLRLPGSQHDLVEAVLDTGVPTVLVVVSGRPYALGDLADRCAAVVQAFMPGAEGGHALAGVLTGRVDPSGRLPVGVPGHHGGQPGTYLAAPLAWHSEGVSNLDPRPLYPFGHGLSYSRHELVEAELSSTTVEPDGEVELEVTLRNTGDRAGATVVQVYVADDVAEVVRPLKQLVAFRKVRTEPGAHLLLRFVLPMDLASFTGRDGARVVEPGRMRLLVGTSSEDLPHDLAFDVVGERRVVGEGRRLSGTCEVREAR